MRAASRFDPARVRALAADLAAAVSGEVRFDAGSRALYAADASNYRQVPIGVVVPRSAQIRRGTGRAAVHSAELLAAAVRGEA